MSLNLVRYQVAKRVLAMNPPVAPARALLPVFGNASGAAYRMLDRMLDEGVLVRKSHGRYAVGDCDGVLLPRGSELMAKVLEHLLQNDSEEGVETRDIAAAIFEANEEVRERLRRAVGKGLAVVAACSRGAHDCARWRASEALRAAHAELAALRAAARTPS